MRRDVARLRREVLLLQWTFWGALMMVVSRSGLEGWAAVVVLLSFAAYVVFQFWKGKNEVRPKCPLMLVTPAGPGSRSIPLCKLPTEH